MTLEERKPLAIAGGVAVALVLAFAALPRIVRRNPLPRLRVAQRNATRYGEVAEGSPAGVLLRVVEGRGDDPEGRPLDVRYRVTDADGREFPLDLWTDDQERNYRWVPPGYARAPHSPRLEAWLDGRLARTVPLAPFPPPPSPADPPASPDAPFRLVARATGARVVPRRPLPQGESWSIDALATRYAPDLRGKRFTHGAAGGGAVRTYFPSELALPYPRDAGWVRVRLGRSREERRAEDVPIRGLRLARLNGETGFLVPRAFDVPNRLGLRITVPAQAGQVRPSARDHRQARLMLTTDAPAEALGMEILRPRPEELGLAYLQIGGASRSAAHPAHGPVRSAPFDAVVRIVYRRRVALPARTYVVPIDPR